MSTRKYPAGWDEARVRRVLEHYESQSYEEAVAEDESAWERPHSTFIEVPNDLVAAVEALIARHNAS